MTDNVSVCLYQCEQSEHLEDSWTVGNTEVVGLTWRLWQLEQ